MLKKLAVALVGMAMGALAGVFVAMMGAGNLAIILGAAAGAAAFSIGISRAGKSAGAP